MSYYRIAIRDFKIIKFTGFRFLFFCLVRLKSFTRLVFGKKRRTCKRIFNRVNYDAIRNVYSRFHDFLLLKKSSIGIYLKHEIIRKKKTEGKGEKKRGKNTCDNRQLTILITEMAPDPIRLRHKLLKIIGGWPERW